MISKLGLTFALNNCRPPVSVWCIQLQLYLVKLLLLEGLCNVLFCHACHVNKKTVLNETVYAFMFDGPKRAGIKFDSID